MDCVPRLIYFLLPNSKSFEYIEGKGEREKIIIMDVNKKCEKSGIWSHQRPSESITSTSTTTMMTTTTQQPGPAAYFILLLTIGFFFLFRIPGLLSKSYYFQVPLLIIASREKQRRGEEDEYMEEALYNPNKTKENEGSKGICWLF